MNLLLTRDNKISFHNYNSTSSYNSCSTTAKNIEYSRSCIIYLTVQNSFQARFIFIRDSDRMLGKKSILKKSIQHRNP